ncbi:unnamed protein product [Anisakis simplex]|uniref:ShKT domain-containing protein n=1 Tax=Anisakis simplex TaxID=6269 RepID=A0A0M3KFS1_ANISI|nr:unnamed protein product [Anisakis simplex]
MHSWSFISMAVLTFLWVFEVHGEDNMEQCRNDVLDCRDVKTHNLCGTSLGELCKKTCERCNGPSEYFTSIIVMLS